MLRRTLFTCAALLGLAACAVNPVTGKREIVLVGEETEIRLGEQNYLPMQQAEGGQYDIDPALTEYVQGVGQKLAAVSDRDLPYEFVVLNNSVPNAWALPGGKIAINRGLLTELESEAELAAVLGHEIVHAAAGHSANQMERGMLLQGLVLGTAIASSDSDYGQLFVLGANIGAQLVNLKYGRNAELEADHYGMLYMSRAGYDPQGAVSLQEKFVRLSEGREQNWLTGLFSSHPPSRERVQANIATAKTLPSGGITGKDTYAAAMERTMEAVPAYKAYEEGRKALVDGDAGKALAKAEEAIAILPQEAHFYALRGDARLVEKEYKDAIEAYDAAIERRDNFFYYYLQRGLAYNEIGNQGRAARDLEKSLSLLPTGQAHYVLGDIAMKRGDRAAAIEHFKVVAGGQGKVAQAAQERLIRLDLPQNPSAYVQTRCDAGKDGQLVISLRNATSVPIGGIAIAVQFRGQAGFPQVVEEQLSGVLGPGEIASLPTRLGPYTPGSGCPVQVTRARVAD